MKKMVLGTAAILVPALMLIWYRWKKQRNTKQDRMDEKQVVRKRKSKIVKTTEIDKDDVRFVIGQKGCVVKDIESRCGVKVTFPDDPEAKEQIVSVKGTYSDDIDEAIEMIKEACQLKPQILLENIEIRAEFCGKIIGKGGDNLRGIRERSGTRILITREPVNGNDELRLCSIEGTREEIDIAKQLIDGEIISEIEIRQRRKNKAAVKECMHQELY